MVNTQLLDDAISKSGLRQNYIYEKIGISAQAFDKKKKNKIKFRKAEIFVINTLLNLSEEDSKAIFFADEVQ